MFSFQPIRSTVKMDRCDAKDKNCKILIKVACIVKVSKQGGKYLAIRMWIERSRQRTSSMRHFKN